MGKSLSFERILLAMTMVSVDAMTSGCSKTESAAPAPETNAPASQPAATATATQPAAPAIATTPPPAAEDTRPAAPPAAVDAGVEVKAAPPPKHKGASASCGAQGCSPDMKKNGK